MAPKRHRSRFEDRLEYVLAHSPARTPEEKQRVVSELIHYINRFEPLAPEKAAWYVEQGLLTPEQAAAFSRTQSPTDETSRAWKLARAYDARGRGGRYPYEKDPLMHQIHAGLLRMKKANPRRTWAQCGANFDLDERTVYRLLARLGR